MIEKRCFLQWAMLTLTYSTAVFFAAYYGVLQMIWQTDITYMTSVIAALFVASVFYLGWSSWHYDHRYHWRNSTVTAVADIGVGAIASELIIRIGLLGTVIGLSLQAQAMASINFADPTNLIAFIQVVARALGSAFFATGCGIVGSVGIIVMTANLNYFIDRDEAAR